MKGILVDASFSASWFLEDEWNETSAAVLDQLHAGAFVCVPNLWLLEMANLLFLAHRRRRIDRTYLDDALLKITRLSLEIFAGPTQMDLTTLRQLSEKYQLTAYDAEYLRIAKEEDLVLATFDGNLTAAAKREKISIIGRV